MALTFNVPLVTPIPSVTQSVIPFRIDQVVRCFFQQLPQSAPPFASAAAMQSKANWDTLIAAVDITKVAYSPTFAGPKITGGKILELAGDSNNTQNGMPMAFGRGYVRFMGEFLCKDAASMKSLDALFNYSQQNTVGDTNLGVVMVNSNKPNGMFFCNSDFSFIKIWNFIRGGRTTEGFAAPDKVPFQFDMVYNWDDNLICVIPTFDPNTSYIS